MCAMSPSLSWLIGARVIQGVGGALLLPVGRGYPIPPTTTLTVGISVRNIGASPSLVSAILRVRPLGSSPGSNQAARADGAVMAQAAVALQFPTVAVAPGEHCLVTIDLVRPHLQHPGPALHWRRTFVIGAEPPAG